MQYWKLASGEKQDKGLLTSRQKRLWFSTDEHGRGRSEPPPLTAAGVGADGADHARLAVLVLPVGHVVLAELVAVLVEPDAPAGCVLVAVAIARVPGEGDLLGPLGLGCLPPQNAILPRKYARHPLSAKP